MKRIALILIVLTSWFLLNQACAVPLNHLFDDKVAVRTRLQKERRIALQRAMIKILVKVSGNKSIATLPLIRNKIDNPERYLQGYTYEKHPDGGYWLISNFNKYSLHQLLRESGQATWGKERPQVITWLVMMQHPQPKLIYADSETQIPHLLYQAANARGIPMILPLADMSDLINVNIEDVVNQHISKLQQASKRYTAPALLLAEVHPSIGGPWEAKWLLVVDGEMLRLRTEGRSLAQVVRRGVDSVTELLASRYAILNTNGSQSTVFISVSDIASVRDYARVAHYLQGLPAVKNVDMRDVYADRIVYALALNGDIHALTQAMALHPILSPLHTEGVSAMNDMLQYRLKSS